ncbi:hypothetical protein PCANC_26932 [Puccinia coronata f. sp. avenae]|uniref:Uncharacterized protein n=1 Tax=Puccinia coronata f. sp. avenae TaxID=200324 RepID=A0A2N5TQP4_9BASI|nr:hypothetical protein PCANC_26932 [Puccinia coronata f. sp. avenae]
MGMGETKARRAKEAGNLQQANALLRSLAKLFPDPTGGKGNKTPGGAVVEPQKPKDTDASGVIPSHGHCGLPSFYNKSLKALKGSIPSTIFDPKWQQKAAAHSAERRPVDQGNTEERRYTGHPAPEEWS